MKTKALAYLFLTIGSGFGVVAIAGPPVLPPLNPQPPSFETCKATGAGAICRGTISDTLTNVPSGYVCGTAQHSVELLISGGTDAFRFTRYYDRSGDLTRRFTHEHFEGTLVNPVTGLSAKISQVSNFIDIFAVPGDLTTSTTYVTGVLTKISLPGSGVLFLDAGRIALDEEGNLVAQNGHHDFISYFFNGDVSVLAPVCEALGTPGTP